MRQCRGVGDLMFCLALLLATGLCLDASNACRTLYSQLGSATSVSSAECGLLSSTPCPTISEALENAASNGSDADCFNIELVSSPYDAPIACEMLYGVENVGIDGQQAGEIPLWQVNCSAGLPGFGVGSQTAWLSIVNSSNVAVEHLDARMLNFSCNAAVLIEMSVNVSVHRSRFSHPSINSSAIVSLNSMATLVSSCAFLGEHLPNPYENSDVVSQYRISAVFARQDCRFGPKCSQRSIDREPLVCCGGPGRDRATAILLENSTFQNLGIQPRLDLYRTVSRSENGIAVHLDAIESDGFRAVIRNCSFLNNSSPYDTTVKVFSGDGSENTEFHVEDCSFAHGWSYIGGGIYHEASQFCINSSLSVLRSTFIGNTAYVQGGAIAFAAGSHANLSDVVGVGQQVSTIDGCHFSGNSAAGLAEVNAGGCLSAVTANDIDIADRFNFPIVRISNSVIENSSAHFGAALFASHTKVIASNLLITDCVGESAFSFTNSELLIGENVTFQNNASPGSGGAVSLNRHSLLGIQNDSNLYFINNTASVLGGALYADESSSTVGLTDILEYKSGNGLQKLCFMHGQSTTSYSLKSASATPGKGASVVFEGNRANGGQSIYANSFSSCIRDQNSFLDTAIQYEKEHSDMGAKPQVESGPVWISFNYAMCDCLKPNPLNSSQYWLYHRQCTRQSIYGDVVNSSLYAQRGYQKVFSDFESEFHRIAKLYNGIGGYDALPTTQTFAVPWSLSNYEWYYPRKLNQPVGWQQDQQQDQQQELPSTYVSSVVLYPAPGELFPLDISTNDVFFHRVYSLSRVQVNTGSVLIISDGYVNPITESILYCTTTPLTIALAGKPGETGTLRVTVPGQVTTKDMVLIIPFRLRPCHLGFTETYQMQHNTTKEMNEYIHSLVKQQLDSTPGSYTNQLLCQCPKQMSGVDSCVNGSDVTVLWTTWAGEAAAGKLYQTKPLEYVTDLKAHEDSERRRKLLTGKCCCGFCTDHTEKNWQISKESPCVGTRQGLMCGQCSPGYGYSLENRRGCIPCTGTSRTVGQFAALITFAWVGVYFFFFSYFDVGRSAVFEAWVTYEQFVLFTSRRDSPFSTLSSLGISGICISNTASIMATISTQYFFFLSFLVWALLLYYLSKLVVVRRFIQNHSLIVGLWALFSFCYASLLYPSFTLLACHVFAGRWVMYSDAAVPCFGARHWPWGALAVFSLVCVAIPLPVLLLTKRANPRIKPLVDVYLSYVKSDKTWYIAYDMGRRFVLILVSVYVADADARQTSLAFVLQVFLLLHFLIQPYRTFVDNVWEAVFLAFACVFAMLNVLTVSNHSTLYSLLVAVYALPVVFAALIGGVRERRKVVVLIEYLLTAVLLPVLVVHARARRREFRRFAFERLRPERPARSGSMAVFLTGKDRDKETERARTVYELRDDFLADVFLQTGPGRAPRTN